MSIYTTAKLGVIDNQIIFNDYTGDPVYRTIARAPIRWQIRQQDIPIPFESGTSDFLTLIGESAYIISGKMYPSSELLYDEGINALRSVCSLELEQSDPASDGGYVPYTWGDAAGNYTKQVFLKPLYCQLAETTKQGFVQPFTIFCKVKDPTIYGGTAKVATTQTADYTLTTGSAKFPVKFPLVIGSATFSVSSIATNNGTLPVYPASIMVHGPVNSPKITNQATGEWIEIDTNLTMASDVLTITYDKDTLTIDLNGASKINYLSSTSTLFKIQPGLNTITLQGSTISTHAYAVVNYYDGYPLA